MSEEHVEAHPRQNPLRWTGEIDRWGYLAWGVGLFAVKFLIDHFYASFVFGRQWTPLDYVAPGLNAPRLLDSGADRLFYATMILLAFPFTYVGLALTLRRLRSADLSRWLLLLFFVPVANLLYFAVLSVIPKRRTRGTMASAAEPMPVLPPLHERDVQLGYGTDASPPPNWFSRWFPQNKLAAAIVAILAPLPIALVMVLLAARVMRNYGWGLFVGLPFAIGLLSAYFYGIRVTRTRRVCVGIAMLSLLVCGAALISFAIEGLGCLIMLLPLAVPIALGGAFFGYSLQQRPMRTANEPWRVMIVLVAALPLMVGAERIGRGGPESSPLFEVVTSVEIDAPPDVVWPNVVRFPALTERPEWIFRVGGIAYPQGATIDGEGPGAIRRCVFSTGTFVEPIEVWDAPRRLRFSVTENPPPLREWSPYADVHPPHLDQYLVSQGGEFRLIDLGNGRTRLEGSTWYRHGMWPAAYWRRWSDLLIHRIHLRVLNHVKRLSE